MAKESIPYFCWRDGGPRWNPGPKVRSLGFKSQYLKDAQGNWLARRPARDAAQELNEAVAKRQASIANGNASLPVQVSAANYERSVETLVDKFRARPKMLLDEKLADGLGKKKLARTSRLAYHAHGRILKDWMGDVLATAITPAKSFVRRPMRPILRMGTTAASAFVPQS